ncbi:MAG: aminotransferase class I/II-fold pyridoxal phosphate-dependent enzyme, partial [Nitrososphaerales archaeon]
GRNRKVVNSRIELASSYLKDLGMRFHRPEGGMYLFAGVSRNDFDSVLFANYLLEEKGVAVVPGIAFGGYPKFFRISVGTDTVKIKRGLSMIGEALSRS